MLSRRRIFAVGCAKIRRAWGELLRRAYTLSEWFRALPFLLFFYSFFLLFPDIGVRSSPLSTFPRLPPFCPRCFVPASSASGRITFLPSSVFLIFSHPKICIYQKNVLSLHNFSKKMCQTLAHSKIFYYLCARISA